MLACDRHTQRPGMLEFSGLGREFSKQMEVSRDSCALRTLENRFSELPSDGSADFSLLGLCISVCLYNACETGHNTSEAPEACLFSLGVVEDQVVAVM